MANAPVHKTSSFVRLGFPPWCRCQSHKSGEWAFEQSEKDTLSADRRTWGPPTCLRKATQRGVVPPAKSSPPWHPGEAKVHRSIHHQIELLSFQAPTDSQVPCPHQDTSSPQLTPGEVVMPPLTSAVAPPPSAIAPFPGWCPQLFSSPPVR